MSVSGARASLKENSMTRIHIVVACLLLCAVTACGTAEKRRAELPPASE